MSGDRTRQSKVRTRPIAITDVAIQKVPCMQFEGFSIAEDKYIQFLHKELLRNVQELCKMRHTLDCECAIIFNFVLKRYEIVLGGIDIVDLDMHGGARAKELVEYSSINSIIYMHNNPSTSTLSAVDINTFIRNKKYFIMTAVGNDGSIYAVQKTYRFDEVAFMSDYSMMYEAFRSKGEKYSGTLAINWMLKNTSRYGLIYKRGAHKR